MNFDIQRCYRGKAIVFSFACYAAFAVLAMGWVRINHGSYGSMLLAAILFLIGPLLITYFSRNQFLHPVRVQITDNYLQLTEELKDEVMIRWATVASYQVEITKALFNSGYTLHLRFYDGSKTCLVLIEPMVSDGRISENAALYRLALSINNFNRTADQRVQLRPAFLASKAGTVLATLTGFLALIAAGLFLLNSHKLNGKHVFGLTMIVVIIAAGFADRKKKSDLTYQRLLELQEGDR